MLAVLAIGVHADLKTPVSIQVLPGGRRGVLGAFLFSGFANGTADALYAVFVFETAEIGPLLYNPFLPRNVLAVQLTFVNPV